MNTKIISQATRFKERPFLFYDKVVLKLVERVNISKDTNLVRTWTIFHKKGDEIRKLYLHKSLSKAICNRKNIAKIKDNNFLLPFLPMRII